MKSNTLLESSVTKVSNMSEAIKKNTEALTAESKKSIEESSKIFKANLESIHSIDSDIKVISQLVEQSVDASKEQVVGVENINQKLLSLSNDSRKSKEISQKNSSSANMLNELTINLNTIKSKLTDLSGKNRAQKAAPEKVIKHVSKTSNHRRAA